MELVQHSDARIIHVNLKTQYDVCATFLRLQEFYESPYPNIQGQFFSLDMYMDTYAADRGNFTYTSDWSGFNVPGSVIIEFAELFAPYLTLRERNLLETCREFLDAEDPQFYLIGTYGEDNAVTIDHELAHAFYYLDHEYRENANILVAALKAPQKHKFIETLTGFGYANDVLRDETQAYLATDSRSEWQDRFGFPKSSTIDTPFKALFQNKKLGPQ